MCMRDEVYSLCVPEIPSYVHHSSQLADTSGKNKDNIMLVIFLTNIFI